MWQDGYHSQDIDFTRDSAESERLAITNLQQFPKFRQTNRSCDTWRLRMHLTLVIRKIPVLPYTSRDRRRFLLSEDIRRHIGMVPAFRRVMPLAQTIPSLQGG